MLAYKLFKIFIGFFVCLSIALAAQKHFTSYDNYKYHTFTEKHCCGSDFVSGERYSIGNKSVNYDYYFFTNNYNYDMIPPRCELRMNYGKEQQNYHDVHFYNICKVVHDNYKQQSLAYVQLQTYHVFVLFIFLCI